MAETADGKSGKSIETPGLHIDTDWKRQAQEEKRKLAEQAAARSAASAPPAPAATPAPAAASAGSATAAAVVPAATAEEAPGQPRRRGELPPAGFAALVQSVMTQILYYLGDLGQSEGVNLDMAKYQLEILSMLEEKTRNNLSDSEKQILDAALYETRTRFVAAASQFI